MWTKLWPILFHVLTVLGPILLGLSQHNFASPAAEGYSPGAQFAGKHLMGAAGVASVAGAVVAFHKSKGQAAATLPPVSGPVSAADRNKLCDLMWANAGVQATPEEIAAIKALRKS